MCSSDLDAVMVPTAAVQPAQDGGQFVFVIGKDGKAQVAPIIATRTVGDRTVVEKGVDAGARVVTDGQSRLTPGATVDVRTSVAGGAKAP